MGSQVILLVLAEKEQQGKEGSCKTNVKILFDDDTNGITQDNHVQIRVSKIEPTERNDKMIDHAA